MKRLTKGPLVAIVCVAVAACVGFVLCSWKADGPGARSNRTGASHGAGRQVADDTNTSPVSAEKPVPDVESDRPPANAEMPLWRSERVTTIQVVDESEKPLEGASITVSLDHGDGELRNTLRTDDEGEARCEWGHDRVYRVEVARRGYMPEEIVTRAVPEIVVRLRRARNVSLRCVDETGQAIWIATFRVSIETLDGDGSWTRRTTQVGRTKSGRIDLYWPDVSDGRTERMKVFAYASGHAPGARRFDLAAEAPADGAIVLKSAPALRGMVIDALKKHPLAGARIQKGTGEISTETYTNQAGEFELLTMDRAGSPVLASCDGYSPRLVEVPGDGSERMMIELAKDCIVGLTVEDDAAHPIAGALVELVQAHGWDGVHEGVTDESGQVTVGLTKGEMYLGYVEAAGFAATSFGMGEAKHAKGFRIVLGRPFTWIGRLVSRQGRAIAGASLIVRRVPVVVDGVRVSLVRHDTSFRSHEPIRHSVTDSYGRFRIPGLSTGRYRWRVSGAGYQTEWQDALLKKPDGDVWDTGEWTLEAN